MFDFQFQKINSTVNIQQNIYGKFLVFPVTNGHGITIGMHYVGFFYQTYQESQLLG